jgi:hypothetical protein
VIGAGVSQSYNFCFSVLSVCFNLQKLQKMRVNFFRESNIIITFFAGSRDNKARVFVHDKFFWLL